MHVPASRPSEDVDYEPTGVAAQEQPFYAPPGGAAVGGAHPFAVPGIRKPQVDSQLNPSCVFDRFIEGDCKRLASSASCAIAQQPVATRMHLIVSLGGLVR